MTPDSTVVSLIQDTLPVQLVGATEAPGLPLLCQYIAWGCSALLALASAAAVLLGGYWFVKRRLIQPKLALAHDVSHQRLDGGRTLLRVRLTAENKGEVVVKLGRCKTWVQQVAPWDVDFMGDIPVPGQRTWDRGPEFGWPVIGETILSSRMLADHQVEPHETEEFPSDFVLDSSLKCVIVYTYLMQRPKRKWWWCLCGRDRRHRSLRRLVLLMRRSGWSRTSVYRFDRRQNKGDVDDKEGWTREASPETRAQSEAR